MKKKENADEKLYMVDKILRVKEKEDGKLYARTKWQGYGYSKSDLTWQPVDSLKTNTQLISEVEAKTKQYRTKPYEKLIESQTEYERKQIEKALFSKPQHSSLKKEKKLGKNSEESKQKIEAGSGSKYKKKMSQSLMIHSKVQAQKYMKNKLNYGLGRMSSEDYYYLKQLKHHAFLNTRKRKSMKEHYYEQVIDQVKGIYKSEDKYIFCVIIEGKAVTYSQQFMLEKLPVNLFNFLTKFLKYMYSAMEKEIKRTQDLLRQRGLKQQSLNNVIQTLNVSRKYYAKKIGVNFGRNEEQAEDNRRMKNKVFEGKLDINNVFRRDSSGSASHSKGKNRKNKKKENILEKQVGLLYNDITTDVQNLKKSRTPSRNPDTSKTPQSRKLRSNSSNQRNSEGVNTQTPDIKKESKGKKSGKKGNEKSVKKSDRRNQSSESGNIQGRKRVRRQSDEFQPDNVEMDDNRQIRRSKRIMQIQAPKKKFRFNDVKKE